MAQGGNFRLDGLEELKSVLGDLSFVDQKRTIDSAIQRAMKPMRSAAKSKAPKGKTGNLKKSIGFFKSKGTASRNNVQRGVFLGPRIRGAQGKGFHAHLVEFGTAERRPRKAKLLTWEGEKGKLFFAKRVKAMRPQPFMIPAYEQHKDTAQNNLVTEVKEVLKRKAARKLKIR